MMKTMLFMLLFVGSVVTATAQVPPPPESKPDEQLTCDEAAARIAEFKERNGGLSTKLAGVKGEVDKLEAQLAEAVRNKKKCDDDIAALIGASEADINAFGQRLGVLEGRMRELRGLSDDQLADRQDDVKALEADYLELRQNRIAVHPDFYPRVVDLGKSIKGLYREKKIKGYVVRSWAENRDCLWNIAGQSGIYGDPLQWPKIWQANTDKIKNPDIIQPGWVLTVPPAGPKTSEEQKAERAYYRKKRIAAAAASVAAPATGNQTAPEKKASEAGN